MVPPVASTTTCGFALAAGAAAVGARAGAAVAVTGAGSGFVVEDATVWLAQPAIAKAATMTDKRNGERKRMCAPNKYTNPAGGYGAPCNIQARLASAQTLSKHLQRIGGLHDLESPTLALQARERHGVKPVKRLFHSDSGSTSTNQRTSGLCCGWLRTQCNQGCQACKNLCKARRSWVSISICARSTLATRCTAMGMGG